MAAKKKFYAVKKGIQTGIFSTWEACKEMVDGFPGAEYKGFATEEEARSYLGEPSAEERADCAAGDGDPAGETVSIRLVPEDIPRSGTLLAYVDGSYNDAIKKYAFGCVFILPDGRIYTELGNGDNPKSLAQRNVAGEMLGAMYATKFALLNGFSALELRYDYEGIEKWVTGEWRSKTELTQKYAQAMREWGSQIKLTFTKVAAHTNVQFNELADQTAKRGLTEGSGVPKIRRIEEMIVYGTGTTE
ncbi:MAG: ribonuclease H family protein [Acetatifactor sp.]|nr:ribonuclease H family protein [Acetatifactor sp.]